MAQKKQTKKIKARDLKPKKDAKGGVVLGPVRNPPTGHRPIYHGPRPN